MRYSPDILLQAYTSMNWKNEYIGELLLPDGDSIELKIHIPKEKCEERLKHLFAGIHRIDFFVQQGTNEYEIAYIEIEDTKVSITYWGMYENTEFDVQIYHQSGAWYCIAMGMERYNPPIKIA